MAKSKKTFRNVTHTQDIEKYLADLAPAVLTKFTHSKSKKSFDKTRLQFSRNSDDFTVTFDIKYEEADRAGGDPGSVEAEGECKEMKVTYPITTAQGGTIDKTSKF